MTFPSHLRIALLSVVAALLLCLPTATALDPQTSLLQAQHTAWTLQDGAPSRIVDLAWTSEGFLWLASQMGLYRFDGMHFVL